MFYHSKQIIKNISYKDEFNNSLKYKFAPIESVGIYVPANLPSTLLMNAIPAKLAKVRRIILANPKGLGLSKSLIKLTSE